MFPLLLLLHYGRHYRRSICNASPIHLISQPSRLPISELYIGSQVWNPHFSPLPLSPRLSTRVATYSTTYLLTPNVLYPPPVVCYRHPLKRKLAFTTSMARSRMLRDLIPGGECARFDAVVLNAYMDCLALYQEDRRHYLRR